MLHWTVLRVSGSYWSPFCLFAVLKKLGQVGIQLPWRDITKVSSFILLCSQLTTLCTSVIVFLKVIGFRIFITKSSLEFSDPIFSSDSPSQYFSNSLSHFELFCRTFLYRISLQFKTSSASQKIRGTPIEKCKGVPERCNKLFGVIKGEVLGNNTGCVIKLLPVFISEVQTSCILYQLYDKYQYPTALCVIVENSW